MQLCRLIYLLSKVIDGIFKVEFKPIKLVVVAVGEPLHYHVASESFMTVQGGNIHNFRTTSSPAMFNLKLTMTTVRAKYCCAVMPLDLPAE